MFKLSVIMLFIVLNIFICYAIDPDMFRTFGEVVQAKGYKFESHKVTTTDGYILTLFRIQGPKDEIITTPKPVVFIQHGLVSLADTHILGDPSPGFLFVDAGYDAWFGNSRGSYHSLEHTNLDYRTDKKYWQFTWQEMAELDLPASIDYVLKITGKNKLAFFGHSQGAITMILLLAVNPDYINKINVVLAMAPTVTVRYGTIDFISVLNKIPLIQDTEAVGLYQFLPNIRLGTRFYEICFELGIDCRKVVGFAFDMMVPNNNMKRILTIGSHETGGTSNLCALHWDQMMKYPYFKAQKYDFGEEGNFEHYGQPEPPKYDLSKVPGPIAVFYGNIDKQGDMIDTNWLLENLPDESLVFTSQEDQFGHFTFVFGNPQVMKYFNKVISIANEYKDK